LVIVIQRLWPDYRDLGNGGESLLELSKELKLLCGWDGAGRPPAADRRVIPHEEDS
jgi:hypothetical protein